jgi:PadR family transcriptional regulator PadR
MNGGRLLTAVQAFKPSSLQASTFTMPPDSTDVIQGTLDMLILKSLSVEPMHGFGISRRIEQVSRGVFRVNPGSLLLAFQRLERQGLVEGEWRISEHNRRAKFYALTPKGAKRLHDSRRDWSRRAAAIARLLET